MPNGHERLSVSWGVVEYVVASRARARRGNFQPARPPGARRSFLSAWYIVTEAENNLRAHLIIWRRTAFSNLFLLHFAFWRYGVAPSKTVKKLEKANQAGERAASACRQRGRCHRRRDNSLELDRWRRKWRRACVSTNGRPHHRIIAHHVKERNSATINPSGCRVI